jgi:hypothetical protein
MTLRMTRWWVVIAMVLVTGGFVGCHGEIPTAPTPVASSGSDDGGGGNAPAGTGRLTIGLKDSPFSDAKAVLVKFSEVSVHRSGFGWEPVAFADGATERTCDLKQLQAATDVLGVGSLPAGHYTQVRLTVDSAALYFENAATTGPCAPTIPAPDNLPAALKIPSGEIKLNREFTVPAGGATTMLLDFDGDRSIKQTGSGNGNGKGAKGSYTMTPVITVESVH